MREILFKAKRLDNGEWVEGYYFQLPKTSLGATIIANGDLCAEDVADYILVIKCRQHSNFSNSYPLEVVECEYYEIDPETICQYTGLTDKNGKRIWENDIVRLGEDEDLLIKWSERYAGWCLQQNKWMFEHFFGETVDEGTCEVVGNIFDNPELLKGE